MRDRSILPNVLVLVLLFAPRVVLAQAPAAKGAGPSLTASLAWARADGAEECIAAPQLAKDIEARLGREVFVSPAVAEVTVEGSVAALVPPQKGFRASFRVLDKSGAVLGSRQVESHEASCRALDDRASLIASILIDDAERVRHPEPPPLAPPSAPIPPVVPPASSPQPEPKKPQAPKSEPGWAFGVDVGLGMTSGLQPGAGLGVAATFVVRPPRFGAFFFGAGLFPETRTSTARGAEVGADAQYGTIGVCPLVGSGGRLDGMLCAGMLLGALRAQGTGFDESYGDRVATVSALLGARGALRIVGPLALSLGLGAHVGLVRAEVTYREANESRVAFSTAPAGILGDVGLGLRFP